MKQKLLLLFLFTYSMISAKDHENKALSPALSVTLETHSTIPGELNFTLTIVNTGDEPLINVQWFSPGITYNSTQQPMLFTGQLIVIEGTKIFSGCSDSNIAQVMAQTLTGPSIFQIGSSNYVSSSVPSAPHVTSVITTDCYQVPVTGNLTITLSGLPSGSWTLHGDNASNYTYSGFGTTAVLNIDSSIVGTGMHFYYDGPNSCASAMSQVVTTTEIHNYDIYAPMYGTYFDANSDGITNAGDRINYQIMVINIRACALNAIGINGFAPNYANANLSFSGSPNISVDVPGYTTLAVTAYYTITTQDIINGSVTNSTFVNPHWSDGAGGQSSGYFPSCTTTLNVMGVSDLYFQNFTSYPNPVQRTWQISNGASIDKVEFMTILGQHVRTVIINSPSAIIDLGDLSSSLYLAKIYSGTSVKVVRIIKE